MAVGVFHDGGSCLVRRCGASADSVVAIDIPAMDFDLAVTMGWSYSYTYTLMVGYQFLLITGQWWAVLLATGIAVIYLIEFYNRWMNYGWSSAVWF